MNGTTSGGPTSIGADEVDDVLVEVVDPVAVIRLNRPEKLNALTHPMLQRFRAAIDAAAADPAVVGIVVAANGRGFCSGLDASVLAATTAAGDDARAGAAGTAGTASPAPDPAEIPGLFTYLLAVPKPVIAAIDGVAAGGGLVLAAMCDVRFAGPDASFTTIFLKRGLVSEHGTSWVLPRLLGPGRALDLLWSSRRIDAAEAARIGLVEHLVDAATPGGPDVVDAARAYVTALAANASPEAMADTKRLVYAHLGLGYPEALRDADQVQWAAVARSDAAEGAAALIERRAPQFRRLGAP